MHYTCPEVLIGNQFFRTGKSILEVFFSTKSTKNLTCAVKEAFCIRRKKLCCRKQTMREKVIYFDSDFKEKVVDWLCAKSIEPTY